MNSPVFISYSRKNYNNVVSIKSQIDNATGQNCWMDLKGGIETGASRYDDEIIEGVKNCKVFLFMLSAESQSSDNAIGELDLAKARGKKIVLVNIDNCELNDRFILHYGRADIIYWHNSLQKDKMMRDLRKWLNLEAPKTQPTSPKPQTTPPPSKTPLQELEERLARLDKEVGELTWFQGSNRKYGYKDKTGKVIIPCIWGKSIFEISSPSSFHEGLSTVMDNNGKFGFIDKTGIVVIPCIWNSANYFSEGLAAVEDSNGKWGYIDKTGKVVIPCKWGAATGLIIGMNGFFQEGYAAVTDSNNKMGFIDKTGKVVIPCTWNNALEFSEGLAAVKDTNGKWGFIDKSGKLVIPCKWKDAHPFKNGKSKVTGKASLFGTQYDGHTIDKNGRVID